jgi:hypothetical protein
MLAGAGGLVLAAVFWMARDFVPSLAASHVTASAIITTTAEPDDARVRRAFARAKDNTHADARLDAESDPTKPVRNSTVTVLAASEDEALAILAETTDAMQRAFADEGPGEFLVNASRHAEAVPNGTTAALGLGFRVLAVMLMLGGLGLIGYGWRNSGLPKQVLWAILAGIGLCAITLIPGGAWPEWLAIPLIVMPIPVLITVLIFRKTREVRRAAGWACVSAVIKDSRIKAGHHRFAGDTTQVRNKAAVTYEFTAGGNVYTGTRISIGENPAEGAHATVRRYAKGTTVPVYYDPDNPQNCVLERDAPVSAGCLWGGAATLLLAGAVISALIVQGDAIGQALSRWVPGIQHPQMVIGSALMGLFAILGFIAGRRQATKAASWPVAQGQIVSSNVESFHSSTSDDTHRIPHYKAVIEYRYEVQGQEYHSSRLSLGAEVSSSSRAAADKLVALHPAGRLVNVHYDPQDPASATLDTRFFQGGCLLMVALILFSVAIYAATHP